MREKEIIGQNQEYFTKYPNRAGWLTQVSPCRKGAHWDIEYKKECLMLVEIGKDDSIKGYKKSGRIVVIDDNGIYDGDKK